jgi:phosphopantothenoylcysteine decarboxylase/phosphopantothenate--cysteine ligase
MSLLDKNILLIISGGIAAYKTLDLIRKIRKSGGNVRCILTKGGRQFVTPLSISTLSENKAYTDLWSLGDEAEMGHIRLSRESDLIVIAPASADIIAKMAYGLADDLATTTLLAADAPIMIVPAMNPQMWKNAATQCNIGTLKSRGMRIIGPEDGETACGETGTGRMSEPEDIFEFILGFFNDRPLKEKTALVTSGPTHEPLDPVRFIGNRSSGKQGHAIATALHNAGADVTLISGPVALKDPCNIKTIHIETAKEMLEACQSALPSDIAICAAAVSDWRPEKPYSSKIKKRDQSAPDIQLTENPDILKTLATHKQNRPSLVIGFAAETENLLAHAKEKRQNKGCDWILANEVGPNVRGEEKTFGAEENHIYFVTEHSAEEWPKTSKQNIAHSLVQKIIERIEKNEQ